MTQPAPILITGHPLIDWALLVGSFVVVVYYLKAIRLARATVRQILRLYIGGFLLGLVYFMVRGKPAGDSPLADGIVFGVVALMFVPHPKRSRYISAKVRREIIARDLRGEAYDPQKHHIDHKWAFSRGGGHTTDNLRVIEKEKNLRKGAKKPSVWEMFFR
jgi:hypothetical protein